MLPEIFQVMLAERLFIAGVMVKVKAAPDDSVALLSPVMIPLVTFMFNVFLVSVNTGIPSLPVLHLDKEFLALTLSA